MWQKSFWESANSLLNCKLWAKSTTTQPWMQSWRIWLILLTFPCCLILRLMAAFFLAGCSLVNTQKQKYEKQTAHTGIRERAALFPRTVPKGLFAVQFYNYLSQYQHVYSLLDATQMLGLNSSSSLPSFRETSLKTSSFPENTLARWGKFKLYSYIFIR